MAKKVKKYQTVKALNPSGDKALKVRSKVPPPGFALPDKTKYNRNVKHVKIPRNR